MKISVVIPNYNGEKLIEKNLPRICRVLEESKEDIEIIIADDASTDSSIQTIQQFIQSKLTHIPIKVVKKNINSGFSTNANNGIQSSSGEIIVLLNTDVVPEKGFLKPLLNHFDDSSVFAVGCLDKSKEGEKTVLRGRGLGKWDRGLLIHSRGEVDEKNTFWVSGGSGAFRKSIWKLLGGFDSIFDPYYWEDIDLSYRAVKSGYKIIFEPKSVVLHEHDLGSIKSQHSKKKVSARAYRNQYIFIWKNITDFKMLVQHLLWLPVHVGKAIVRKDEAYLRGIFWAVLKLSAIQKSRYQAKKLFKISDREVIRSASSV